MFKFLKSTKKGFTLIELLVVIAIIGILSSVVLASLSTARQKSRDAKRISDIGQIQLALELFFDAWQSYPSTTPQCGAAVCTTDANLEAGVSALTTAGFLPQSPEPPPSSFTDNIYFYRGIVSTATAAGECNLASEVCVSYFLGAPLERSDSTVLGTDADTVITAWDAYDNAPRAVGVVGGDVDGTRTGCGGTSDAASPDQCYDVKP